jgi:uncharacterized membrane protein
MKKRTFQTILIFAHFSLMMIVFGGAIMETFINFPNWFHNIPTSLDAAKNFLQVRNSGQFFQTVFPLAILTGIAFVILGWKIKPARNFILAAVVLSVGVEIATVAFVYPLLRVMIVEGTAVHSVDALKQTAQQFTTLNFIRLVIFFVAEMLSLIGLWKFTQHAANLQSRTSVVSAG